MPRTSPSGSGRSDAVLGYLGALDSSEDAAPQTWDKPRVLDDLSQFVADYPLDAPGSDPDDGGRRHGISGRVRQAVKEAYELGLQREQRRQDMLRQAREQFRRRRRVRMFAGTGLAIASAFGLGVFAGRGLSPPRGGEAQVIVVTEREQAEREHAAFRRMMQEGRPEAVPEELRQKFAGKQRRTTIRR